MARHWSEIARTTEIKLAGLERKERASGIRDAAEAMGIEPHTLRRYLALYAFIVGVGVREQDWTKLAVGPLEVVLRLWQRDPAGAATALRLVRAGKLSFRAALALERRLRDASPPSHPDGIGDDDVLASLIASNFGVPASRLRQADQLDDARFEIVQVQRLFLADGRYFAYLDEASIVPAPGLATVEFVRRVLLASLLFDGVLVAPAYDASRKQVEGFLALVREKASVSVVILLHVAAASDE